jgi:type 1 glutamine amidotransferase
MQRHCTLFVILAIFISGMQITYSQEPAAQPIRVLIVDDQSSGYYQMVGTATILRNMIRQDKRFEAVLAEDAEILGTDIPFDYDVILLHFKNYRIPKRNAAMKANLDKFVTDGGGLFVFHFACGAFEDWQDFDTLAGRVWDPKLPPHDPYGQFTVKIIDNAHPITRNPGNVETHDELYTCLKASKVPIHVLAESVSKVDGKPYPMAFTLEKGKGRIFHTTLGHDEQSLSATGVQTMIKRALAWCAKRENLPPSAPAATKEEANATEARLKEITDSLPEEAKLLAYLDCGGAGCFEQGLKLIAPDTAKTWAFHSETPIEGIAPQQMTVLYDTAQLSFMIEGLDRTKKYQLNVVWWDFDASGRTQSLVVQSQDLSMVRILRAGAALPDFKESGLLPKTVTLGLPLAFVQDGRLVLNINNEGGANTVVSEIWINELP